MISAERLDRIEAEETILREHQGGARGWVEALIRQRFYETYDAQLTHLMPRLFTVTTTAPVPGSRWHDQRIMSTPQHMVGAFGLREAALAPLFMEQYLDQPVEQVISAHAGGPVARHRIVEVGNLVTDPGGARQMIISLTRYLHRHGFDWVVFTGVASLRAAFVQLGLRPFFLAMADPHRLSDAERACWGRYFAARPQVMGGHIAAGYLALQQASPHLRGPHLSEGQPA
jgi:hypothetical protein